jgi:Asp-tRNA(Asn)/Glu-tRNA(Gln) amidotransferase A subunit family amidase
MNHTPQTNPFVERCRVAPSGRGVLDGVRLAVKDNIAVEGKAFTAGHPLFTERRAHHTATAVQRLLAAGAEIVGMARTDAGGFGVTSPGLINPVFPDRTLGGSSSGPAAAVAADFADLGLGTDTGGSIRVPAACTAIFGYKPFEGVVPGDGVWPLAPCFDTIGLLARDLHLLACGAAVLIDDPRLPSTEAEGRRLVLGFDEGNAGFADDATRSALASFLSLARRHGHIVRPLGLPHRGEIASVHRTLALAEARGVYANLSEGELARLAPAARADLARAEAIDKLAIERSGSAARLIKEAIRQAVLQVDALIGPTLPAFPPFAGTSRVEIGGRLYPIVSALLSETRMANVAGLPALSMPTGIHRDGIPFSVQIMASDDRTVFRIARALSAIRISVSQAPRAAAVHASSGGAA